MLIQGSASLTCLDCCDEFVIVISYQSPLDGISGCGHSRPMDLRSGPRLFTKALIADHQPGNVVELDYCRATQRPLESYRKHFSGGGRTNRQQMWRCER
jgi:hypothetical protein